MADPFAGAGGGGGGTSSGRGSVTVGGSQVISPLAIPELLQLFNKAQGQTPTRAQMPSLQDMITGGMNSPLLQSVLGPALQRLQAPQQQQQQQFTEASRAAGGLRSSQYNQGFNQLLNQQGLQTNDLMGQVISQVLGQLLQGQLQEQRNQFLPAETFTNLLRAAAPSVGKGGASASTGWENIPPSLGLGTPMQGDVMSAITGRPSAGGSGFSGAMAGAPTGGMIQQPQQPPQYIDPWASAGMGGGGGLGGGQYDLGMGGGTEYLLSPATPGYGGSSIEYGEWQDVPQVLEGWY